jgi:hypothetical protein
MTEVTSGIPGWRVSLLRPDGSACGEGTLLANRLILVRDRVVTDARPDATASSGKFFDIDLRYGIGPATRAKAAWLGTVSSFALLQLRAPAPVRSAIMAPAAPTPGTPVSVATRSEDSATQGWASAVVGLPRADGAIELGPNPLTFTAGAVVDDSDGTLVGFALDNAMRPIDWFLDTGAGEAGLRRDERTESTKMVEPRLDAESSSPDSPIEAQPISDGNEQPATDGDTDQESIGSAQPLPRLATDAATVQDRLERRMYVDAIVTFLRHPDTRPPLTIGIHGSWGAGKTSLMRMVQDELDPGAATGAPRRLWYGQARRHNVTNGEVVQTAKRPPEAGAGRAVPADGVDGWRPTVWFNPWTYQNGDQVWAGLAHAIISQITDRLPRGDRERFWLRLNLKRTDAEEVRRRWYGIVARRVLPVLLWWLLGLAAGTATLLVLGWLCPALAGLLHDVARWAELCGGFAALASGFGSWLWARLRPAASTFDRLLHQPPMVRGLASELASASALPTADPGYDGKLGFLHLVQSDMRRVLDLVASSNRPLVVFVDDLDRCSPGTVQQVIEAINLFLAGEFGNCVFVLGMEPTAVSTSVSAAYQNLATDGAELGWRFLAKFVQLPIRVPEPDPDSELTNFLDHLLDGRPATRNDSVAPRPSILETFQASANRRRLGTMTGPGLGTTARRGLETTTRRRIATAPDVAAGAVQEFAERYSDQDAAEPIRAALPSLGTGNPREVKRYVNLFRFYTFLAERLRLRGAAVPEPASIAKLAAFTIRWPQLVSTPGAASAAALTELESAAAGEDDHWHELLAAICPGLPAGTDGALREFLRSDPAIGADGFRLR